MMPSVMVMEKSPVPLPVVVTIILVQNLEEVGDAPV